MPQAMGDTSLLARRHERPDVGRKKTGKKTRLQKLRDTPCLQGLCHHCEEHLWHKCKQTGLLLSACVSGDNPLDPSKPPQATLYLRLAILAPHYNHLD
uniref:Phorbol-ester/DAG-type domain-containing protein n=1 Tax=Panagrellus redivivus TaxID=6233 RepID=A0A7E4VWN5_PANRE